MMSNWSPRAWPRLSLTILKRSRSTNSIAELRPGASPSSLSASERKWSRLGSEVTGSYMPRACAFSIDARTSANKRVHRRRELGHATGDARRRRRNQVAVLDGKQPVAKRGQRAGALAVGALRRDVADQQAEHAGNERRDDLLIELGEEQRGEKKTNDATPAAPDRIALLIFWAVPAFIGVCAPRAAMPA